MILRGLMRSLLPGLMVYATGVMAQPVNWETFDPKKATAEEIRQMHDFLENNIRKHFAKITGDPREVRSLIIHGNKITTVVYNYGNINRPGTLSGTADLVWNRLGYGYEFSPLVAGEVTDRNGKTVHILDDGMWERTQGGYAPDGSIKYGWLPKAGYAAPGQPDVAAWSHRSDVGGDLTRKPHSWPESWYNPTLGRYVWPAFLGNDATSPDEEVYFVDDDYTNAKYAYYPFPNDTTKRGLGLDLECRFFQFNNPLAEDLIFLVYRVTNKSPKTINKVYFGMFGDPHVGGGNDYSDDRAYFIPPKGTLANGYPQRARSMVYAWDDNGQGDGGLTPGYFGFKFLESPTNSTNGKDDDDDGIIDESPFNDTGFYIDGTTYPLTYGIADTAKYVRMYGKPRPRWSGDENGDWNPDKDDVGIDGLPGTGDLGEGNHKPDIGNDANGNIAAEPHFGIRDVNESDQIGLTSFWAQYAGSPYFPSNDVLFWQEMSADSFAIDQELLNNPGDNSFLYSSGPFPLPPEGTQRFSIALLMGENLADLVLNSETSQRILESNYQFAQPPPKPNVRVVPGDRRVTLYWDNVAEISTDPLSGVNDFEGYKIYRSEDYTFADVYTITDANGVPFLRAPFVGTDGKPAQFDLVNGWFGFHPVDYLGRGVKYQLGSNTGLVHSYVDSSVTNGKTYYYAVASYDHGFDSLSIALPPTESQITISRDAITGAFTYDVNTVSVVPAPLASGTVGPRITNNATATRTKGISTGLIRIQMLDSLQIPDQVAYGVDFRANNGTLVYDVHTDAPTVETIVSRDTQYVPLSNKNLDRLSVVVKAANGSVVDTSKYVVDAVGGRIRGRHPGSFPAGEVYTVQYGYYDVAASDRLHNEDDNPTFKGMRVFVNDDPLGLDSLNSGWITKNNTNLVGAVRRPVSALTTNPFRPAPIDIQFQWNRTDTTASGKWMYPGDTLLNNFGLKVVVCPFRVVNVTDSVAIQVLVDKATTDSVWRPGREMVFITPPKYSPSQTPRPVMTSVTFYVSNGGTPIYPTQGNIYEAKTTKPFKEGDRYAFTTTAARFETAKAESQLDRIYVVPNPYVVYSNLELPGSTATNRGQNVLQFRNLPPRCTIRIYTMTGELVDTIHKDDGLSYASWNVLSYEGQRLAYGVYIYHVEVPDVGEKIGRFGLIK
jgi:hypothetical protein